MQCAPLATNLLRLWFADGIDRQRNGPGLSGRGRMGDHNLVVAPEQHAVESLGMAILWRVRLCATR
jgi:hypothetical protein